MTISINSALPGSVAGPGAPPPSAGASVMHAGDFDALLGALDGARAAGDGEPATASPASGDAASATGSPSWQTRQDGTASGPNGTPARPGPSTSDAGTPDEVSVEAALMGTLFTIVPMTAPAAATSSGSAAAPGAGLVGSDAPGGSQAGATPGDDPSAILAALQRSRAGAPASAALAGADEGDAPPAPPAHVQHGAVTFSDSLKQLLRSADGQSQASDATPPPTVPAQGSAATPGDEWQAKLKAAAQAVASRDAATAPGASSASPSGVDGAPGAARVPVAAVQAAPGLPNGSAQDSSGQKSGTEEFDRLRDLSSGNTHGPAGVAQAVLLASPATQEVSTLAAAHVAPPPLATAEPPIENQIVQALHMQWREGSGEARVTLRPDYLGEVSIQLRVEGERVTATIAADQPQVREWMQQNEEVLRQGLAERGLSLEQLVIADDRPSDETPSEQRRQQPQQEQEEAPSRQRTRRADEPTFEVIV